MKKPITYFREIMDKDLDFLSMLARYRRYTTEKGRDKIDKYINEISKQSKDYLKALIISEKKGKEKK